MQKIEYKNFITEWSELFPEFLTWKEYGLEKYDYEGEPLAYVFLSEFCRFMMQKLEEPSAFEDEFFIRLFAVINKQFELEDSDEDTLTLIVVEIFENLAQTEKGMEVSRKLLTNQKAIDSFKKSLEFTGIGPWKKAE